MSQQQSNDDRSRTEYRYTEQLQALIFNGLREAVRLSGDAVPDNIRLDELATKIVKQIVEL